MSSFYRPGQPFVKDTRGNQAINLADQFGFMLVGALFNDPSLTASAEPSTRQAHHMPPEFTTACAAPQDNLTQIQHLPCSPYAISLYL